VLGQVELIHSSTMDGFPDVREEPCTGNLDEQPLLNGSPQRLMKRRRLDAALIKVSFYICEFFRS
ncbi:MAG: hypothetical protein AB7E24_12060, partial [Novosphingobium sp.]